MLKPRVSERAQQVLKVLVEHYIHQGQAIGSKTIAATSSIGVSAATIRNVLAELEEQGLIRSPHTSAGRIPTSLGYRFFIDSLLTVKPLDSNTLAACQSQLAPNYDRKTLLKKATNLLSTLSRFAGVVMINQREQVTYRHIDFVRLSEQRVLVILVTEDAEVHNRIICLERKISAHTLEQAVNYLNRHIAGKPIQALREALVAELQADHQHVQQLMQQVMHLAEEAALNTFDSDDYIVAGKTNLLKLAQETGLERLQTLFETFKQKHTILHLLDKSMQADGVQIFIGEESGYESLHACSVVTARYDADNRAVGVLGIIGPTRMAYDSVIPLVDVTAKLLSAALKQ
ncbi:MAG: heat-inducible transcriptional repressor HrcA [Gammaproteobacteria bacterium]